MKKLKVGFDMDGVVLYNPARIIRPLISLLKDKGLIKRRQLQFYVPTSNWEKRFWWLFHQSSIFVAPGLPALKKMVDMGSVEAYLITGRFSHLKPDFEKWRRRFESKKIFTKYYLNEKDEQPHLFKEKMINKLGLDVFIEDNWDIVNYLQNRSKKKTKIFWIYNLFDRGIDYPDRFSSLSKTLDCLQTLISNNVKE